MTPLYHFHLLYRHLDIRPVINAESSPLHPDSNLELLVSERKLLNTKLRTLLHMVILTGVILFFDFWLLVWAIHLSPVDLSMHRVFSRKKEHVCDLSWEARVRKFTKGRFYGTLTLYF